MSRDWTPKEITAVSEYMKRSGNMGYEEFAAGLKRQVLVLESIRRFSEIQCAGVFPCPRCGRYVMSSDPMRNAMSRYADIQVCDNCGMDEAIRDFSRTAIPITAWAIAEHPEVFIATTEPE